MLLLAADLFVVLVYLVRLLGSQAVYYVQACLVGYMGSACDEKEMVFCGLLLGTLLAAELKVPVWSKTHILDPHADVCLLLRRTLPQLE